MRNDKEETMQTTNKKIVTQLISFAILLGLQFSMQASGVEKQEFFSAVESIKVNTISGNLKLGRSTGGDVEVHVYSTFNEDKISMEMEQNGGMLNLSEKSHGSSSSRGNSKWTIGIPEGMNIKVKFSTASGDIVVTDLSTHLKMNTASGDITLTNYSGRIKGNTASGDIKLENVSGSIDLNTASGDISADTIEGHLKLNTASGDIDIASAKLNEKSSFDSASGNVLVSVSQTPLNDLTLTSASGNVELSMQGNTLQGSISMTTKKGFRYDINAPFEFDNTEEYERHGDKYITKTVVLGDPQTKIILSTSSGDATIND